VHLPVSFIVAELPGRVDVGDLIMTVKDEGGDVDHIAGLHLALLDLLRVHTSLGNNTLHHNEWITTDRIFLRLQRQITELNMIEA